jgi:hypothetical protein
MNKLEKTLTTDILTGKAGGIIRSIFDYNF